MVEQLQPCLWEHIGSSFVHHYYKMFDTERGQLANLYLCHASLTHEHVPHDTTPLVVESHPSGNETSCLSFEGYQFQGKKAIMDKLNSLPFKKIEHIITAQDHQPTPDSGIVSMVVGQLKADNDHIMGFHQCFILKQTGDLWVCTNDMFRLAIHNFG